jgi:hypothetical protein
MVFLPVKWKLAMLLDMMFMSPDDAIIDDLKPAKPSMLGFRDLRQVDIF